MMHPSRSHRANDDRALPKRLFLGHLLLLFSLPLACDQVGARIPNPVVRVDLRGKLPKDRKLRAKLQAAMELDCHRKTTVSAGEVRHSFMVNWRVADIGPQRFVLAVDVEPIGKVSGGKSARASAAVIHLGPDLAKKDGVDRAMVSIRLEAQKGCGQVKHTHSVQIRSDDPSCGSDSPKKLLSKSKGKPVPPTPSSQPAQVAPSARPSPQRAPSDTNR